MNYLYKLPKLPCLIYLFFWFVLITWLVRFFLHARRYIYLQGLGFTLCLFHFLSSTILTLKQCILDTGEDSVRGINSLNNRMTLVLVICWFSRVGYPARVLTSVPDVKASVSLSYHPVHCVSANKNVSNKD